MSDIAEAASVVLAQQADSTELFLIQRAENLRFFGSFHAFPGGRVGREDAEVAATHSGVTARQVVAIRELFEETGVLLAHHADGSFPASEPALDQDRRALLEERLTFADFLRRRQLSLWPGDLTPVGSLVTPAFSPIRFDTAFFTAVLPPGQSATVWPGELARGFWARAADILTQWEAGDILVSPPTVAFLQAIRGRPVRDLPHSIRPLLDYLDTDGLHPIWFSPGVLMLPLRCQGLAPSTHTNAFLVGTDNLYLFDPGPTDPAEQQRLLDFIDGPWRQPGTLRAIVLTHHHPDHIGAANVCARHWGLPILAHPWTAEILRGKIEVASTLDEGAILDLGTAPHGRGRWQLQAIHTPGHAPGHLVFYEPAYHLLFAADMVSTLSSIVIAPPEGDLTQYLASLQRLQSYPSRLLLPAHGPPSARPAFLLRESLAHRQTREQQLLATLREEPREIPELTLELYRGLPANLMRLAQLQTLAGLQKLQHEGRAELVDGAGWRKVET